MEYKEIKSPSELLKYMNDNINYVIVDKNNKIYKDLFSEEWNKNWFVSCIVQDGESLIKTKYGTCWDQVELERKWFEENDYKYKTIFTIFEEDFTNNLPTHSFLMFYENEKWYWFEHSADANKGIHESK